LIGQLQGYFLQLANQRQVYRGSEDYLQRPPRQQVKHYSSTFLIGQLQGYFLQLANQRQVCRGSEDYLQRPPRQ